MNIPLLTTVHAGEQLRLLADWECNNLLVHLGSPTTVINVNGHRLTWRHLELTGAGVAEIRDGARLVRRWFAPAAHGAF